MRGLISSLVAGAVLAAAPAGADVTLTSVQTGKMAGGDGLQVVQRIKGGKMRTDVTKDKEVTSIIFDVEAGKMMTIDHKKKEAVVMDTAVLVETVEKVKTGDITATLTPTSETKQVAGYACTVHNSDVKVAFSPGEGMNLTIGMTGPACLSKTAPGQQEYAEFYRIAVQKGFFFTDPRAAKAMPGPAKGLAELHRKWAEAGVPLSSTTTIKFDGGGFMTGMMNKMMGGATTTEVSKIETAAIADSEFVVPAGYKTKTP